MMDLARVDVQFNAGSMKKRSQRFNWPKLSGFEEHLRNGCVATVNDCQPE